MVSHDNHMLVVYGSLHKVPVNSMIASFMCFMRNNSGIYPIMFLMVQTKLFIKMDINTDSIHTIGNDNQGYSA